MNILTGDIGGTHTRLATIARDADRFHVADVAVYSSADYTGLLPIIESFLTEIPQKPLQQAAFGVAGPVVNGHCQTTNLPWELSASELSVALDIPEVYLLNDLEALAWGIDTLDDAAMATLQAGQASRPGNRAVIAAGTGLGQAGMSFDGTRHLPFACEGGHTDFAPQTERDIALLLTLQARYGHVSWERLVSGDGLVELFRQLLDSHALSKPDWFEDPQQDTAAAISQRAQTGDDALCVEALEWFIELYGREAGNLALKLNATGGVYLGGGIAPKILAPLRSGRFIQAFLDKGRMRPLLEAMPVRVICEEYVALYGLARYATQARDFI